MPLISQITGRNFNTIGLVGETPTFSDFTPAQIATDGFIQSLVRTTEFDRDTVLGTITTDTDGKVAVVNATKTAVDSYLATVFDTVGSTVSAKIFINNVVFADKAGNIVIGGNTNSQYVDRDTIINVSWAAKVQVS